MNRTRNAVLAILGLAILGLSLLLIVIAGIFIVQNSQIRGAGTEPPAVSDDEPSATIIINITGESSATPSATVTPSATPTLTVTSLPSATDEPPTPTDTPTATITLTPTAIPKTATWTATAPSTTLTLTPSMTATTASASQTATATTGTIIHASGAEMLNLVNQERCSAGLSALTLNDSQLGQAAMRHTMDMIQNNFFDHTGSDGSDVGTRVTDTGYVWITVGENIAAGNASASDTFTQWWNSAGHKANIMNPDFREMGLAHVEAPGSQYGHYWTQVFGSTGSAANACP